jgi:hypothetical protein
MASAHEPRRGPNGGQVADIGQHHGELVARGNVLRFFLFDGADQPLPVAGATAQAVVLSGGRQASVTLSPTGANVLQGTGDFTAAPGMRAVVTLTLPNQRPVQARFTPMEAD